MRLSELIEYRHITKQKRKEILINYMKYWTQDRTISESELKELALYASGFNESEVRYLIEQ